MNRIFFYLYTFVVTLIYILVLPLIWIASFKQKYQESIPARFFLQHNTPFPANGVWFHVCSFGEAKAIKPLIEKIAPKDLRLSATTQTGIDVLKSYSPFSRYLPFESLLFSWIQPQKALIVMEAELWYLLFLIAREKGAKTILINARISDRSYPKYKKFRWIYKHIFNSIDEIFAQRQEDKTRLIELGADEKRIVVTGNIKMATLPKPTRDLAKSNGVIICGASTHKNEESLILDAFVNFRLKEFGRLIVVPRHPERFDEVAKEIDKVAKLHSLSWHKFSHKENFSSDIILVDRLGWLVDIYAICDVVILGGAFEKIGGHNAGEVAQFGCKIISGKHYFNQADIFKMIDGIEIVEKYELIEKLKNYRQIKNSSINSSTDITPIIKAISHVL
ncbi:MAG: lipid IV(A) 3-deoxy-D-manno-octulosonic acid transferase [Epsilonproteobacteria bacterium]|nr:lipid IV(A) 3-deoxy-D-manno-octulosonic acid transferase [Campylobacterota bacterium]MBD3839207.1 lipid IV(A) 3-deoxy-D-manno-octulosonic acid transferase [Campylobacterota bacterium]